MAGADAASDIGAKATDIRRHHMAHDEDWVQDVRLWYFGGHPPPGEVATDGSDDGDELAIGYEAAAPRLQGMRWPDTLLPGDL
jgi:hypothetical protein